MDSIIASTAYAYLSQQLIQLIVSNELTSTSISSASLCFPIIQIQRSDLSLRPECIYVFNECDFSELDTSQLLFLDDVLPYLDRLSSNYDINLILVDHNKLISPWNEKFNDKIDTILDHHQDEGLYLNIKNRQIEPVGSATSLVVLHFKDVWEKKISRDEENSWHTKLAKLLLAPILVDTILLDVSKGRTTNKDQEATQFLLDVLKIPKSNQFDVSHLSNLDLLRKDYKEWTLNNYRVGISSVTWSLEGWIYREGNDVNKLVDSFKSFTNKKKLDMFIVMMAYNHKDKGFQRGFVLLSNNDRFLQDKFIQQLEIKLSLNPSSFITNMDYIRFYHQENIALSRKQIYPLVKELIFKINQ